MTSKALDRTLAEARGARLVTQSGTELSLRPVTVDDGVRIAALFEDLGPDGLRFRFLSGMAHMTFDHVMQLIEVDHRHTEHLLAFAAEDRERPVASLLIAADPAMESGDVAVAVRQAWRGRGAGYALLRHAVELARERGLRVLRSVESRVNHDAVEVERALGFTVRAFEGEPALVVVEKTLA